MRDEDSEHSGKRYGKMSAAALVLIGFLGAGWATLEIAERAGFELTRPTARTAIPARFDLIDHRGQAVTEQDFVGRPALYYFGYTYCPDVCPTHLSVLLETVDLLQAGGLEIQPVFVSIDPARDTVDEMHGYVGHFGAPLIGLTGSAAQIKAAAKVFGVQFYKIKTDPDLPYVMDHSALSYLVDDRGRRRATLQPGLEPEVLAEKIKAFLRSSKTKEAA
jgi:protein SCO1/2